MADPPEVAPKPRFRPIAEMLCKWCGQPTMAAEGSIFVCSGAEAWAYCSHLCARRARVWPWDVAVQLPLPLAAAP